MASSGISTSTVNRDEIVARVLRILNVIKPGEAPKPEDFATVAEALNTMIQAWSAMDPPRLPWAEVLRSYSLPDTAGGQFTIGPGGDVDEPRPSKILGMEIPATGTQLVRMTRREWMAIPDKLASGSPALWLYLPSIPLGQVILWPIPTQTISLRYRQARPLYDFTAAVDTPDLPREVNAALVWNAAAECLPEFAVPAGRMELILKRATEYATAAFGGDNG